MFGLSVAVILFVRGLGWLLRVSVWLMTISWCLIKASRLTSQPQAYALTSISSQPIIQPMLTSSNIKSLSISIFNSAPSFF